MNMTEGFGKRLKTLREKVHPTLTKSDIGRMAGISKSQMSSYEMRDTAEKLEVQAVAALAKVYSTSMEYLCYGTEPSQKLSLDDLKYALSEAHTLLPRSDPDRTAKLVDFIYGLKSAGETPTPGILQAFYRTL